ncbi:peptidoglycan-binding protein [Georgenia sp. SYP-B2076]|uniref:peptidoglycan-binding protein n=1 Tax=Georgenia sp. SYP-B2076 TaxID=2495881 RepID=UPI000F8EC94F|nr:peptidoglycan-binding protein [Georgenia sp. SYP-B2076]
MTAFDIDVSSPFPTGFTGGLGGPHQGGHQPPDWYIEYGMDLGATEGTEVHAAFDAHITKLAPHDPATDSGKVYGAQLFMRAPNDMMGGFYTHMTHVPPSLAVGSAVARGDVLGTVLAFDGIPPHLALVEIIGGAPGGQYRGVDLYQLFLDSALSETVTPVTFMQDGSPPSPGAGGGGPKVYHLGTLRGIQEALAVLGFDPGVIDGLDGPNTRAAVAQFQGSQGLEPDGQCAGATLDALAAAMTQQGYQVDGV